MIATLWQRLRWAYEQLQATQLELQKTQQQLAAATAAAALVAAKSPTLATASITTAAASAQIRTLEGKVNELTRQNGNLEKENQRLKEEKKTRTAAAVVATAPPTAATATTAITSTGTAEQAAEIAELERKLATANLAIIDQAKLIDEHNDTITRLNKDKTSAEARLAEQASVAKTTRAELDRVKAENATLQATANAAQIAALATTAARTSATQTAAVAATRIAGLEAKLSQAQQDLVTANQQKAEITTARDNLLVQLGLTNRDNEHLRGRVATDANKCETEKKRSDTVLASERAKYEAQIAALRATTTAAAPTSFSQAQEAQAALIRAAGTPGSSVDLEVKRQDCEAKLKSAKREMLYLVNWSRGLSSRPTTDDVITKIKKSAARVLGASEIPTS